MRDSPARPGRPGTWRIRSRFTDSATNTSPARTAVTLASATAKLVQWAGLFTRPREPSAACSRRRCVPGGLVTFGVKVRGVDPSALLEEFPSPAAVLLTDGVRLPVDFELPGGV